MLIDCAVYSIARGRVQLFSGVQDVSDDVTLSLFFL